MKSETLLSQPSISTKVQQLRTSYNGAIKQVQRQSDTALLSHLHLDALPQYLHLLCDTVVEDEGELLVVMACLQGIELDRNLYHSTREQSTGLDVHLKVRVVLELELDTGDGIRVVDFHFICLFFSNCHVPAWNKTQIRHKPTVFVVYLTSLLPLLLISRVWEAGTVPGQCRKRLPKLYRVKENSRRGATALPWTSKENVGPCFTCRGNKKRGKGGNYGISTLEQKTSLCLLWLCSVGEYIRSN